MRPSTAQLRRNAVQIAAQSQLALHEQKNVAGWSQTDVVGTIHHIYVAGPNFSLGRHLVKHGSLIQRPRVLITELQKAMPQSSDCFPSPIALVCVPSTLCTHTSATKYISQGIGGKGIVLGSVSEPVGDLQLCYPSNLSGEADNTFIPFVSWTQSKRRN